MMEGGGGGGICTEEEAETDTECLRVTGKNKSVSELEKIKVNTPVEADVTAVCV